jgi:MinD superfamily P-loop ATPase
MLVAVASGKGGTGKTLVSTSLAWLLAGQGYRVTYVDVDVEEPNGHLFLHPDISARARFTRPAPRLARETCSGCGECQRACRFNAILALPDKVLVFDELCSSCGGCVLACPESALVETPREIGTLETGTALANGDRSLRFASATLDVGEARATPLIGGLLERVEDDGVLIVDAPPGTSCSVMEVVKRADQVILVTEPTPFGLHDLRLAVEMTRAFGKPLLAVINRSDLGNDETRRYLQQQSIERIAEIPHLTEVAAAYARGELAAQTSEQFRHLIDPLASRIAQQVAP